MRGKKSTYQEIQNIIKDKYILLTDEEEFKNYFDKKYNSQNFYLRLKCQNCNNIFKRTIFDLKHSKSCPWGCQSSRTLKTTFNQFLKKFIQKRLNKFFWINFDEKWWQNNYKNITTRNLKLKCKKCKKEIFKSYQNIIDGSGCPDCARKIRNKNKKLNYEDFIERAKKIKYFDQYILPDKEWWQNNYTSQLKTYLNIYCKNCKTHFKKSVNEFLKGSGCSCVGRKQKLTQIEVIENLKNIFPYYDYSRVNYKNTMIKIEIICPKHGSFFKKYNDIISQKQGCPVCSKEDQRSKGENKIKEILEKSNIKFYEQYSIFKENKKLKCDFYLPDYNLVIEYDGEYHFKKIPKREDQFFKTKQRDFLKNKLCFIHKINLIRIPYWKYNNLEEYLVRILKREGKLCL